MKQSWVLVALVLCTVATVLAAPLEDPSSTFKQLTSSWIHNIDVNKQLSLMPKDQQRQNFSCIAEQQSRLNGEAVDIQDFPKSLDELKAGTTIFKPKDTFCSRGTPWYFAVRKRRLITKLNFYFIGGGACFDYETCCANPSFIEEAPSTTEMAYLQCTDDYSQADGGSGLAFSTGSENPLADYTAIILPYCTGDLWIGGGEHTYNDTKGNSCTVNHFGSQQIDFLSRWLFDQVGILDFVDEIVYSGDSAGAYGSFFHSVRALIRIRDTEKKITTSWFGDSGVGVSVLSPYYQASNGVIGEILNLTTEFDDLDFSSEKIVGPPPEGSALFSYSNVLFRELIVRVSDMFPCHSMSEYNPQNDSTQTSYMKLSAILCPTCVQLPSYTQYMEASVAYALNSNRSNLYSSIIKLNETFHTIIREPSFFTAVGSNSSAPSSTIVSAGTKVVDWFRYSVLSRAKTCSRQALPTATATATATATVTVSLIPTSSVSSEPTITSEPTDISEPTTTSTLVPSTSPSPNNDPCFPADAVVELENGLLRQMDQLAIGDRVRVSSTEFSDLYFFGHKLDTGMFPFVHLELANGKYLELSHGHLVWVKGAGWTRGTDVHLGDELFHVGTENESLVRVISTSEIMKRGLFNPHTLHGDLVVNRIRVSSYTDVVYPRFAHVLLAPERLLFKWKMSVLGSHFEVSTPRLVHFWKQMRMNSLFDR
mmetsp:Transcript_10643/g.18250  ORF Transcript_10643/g.18250 Transcript_10643/m.18250 type:complete len:707 (+) Transcript_10643:75-2195(+)